ncbi:hypothetical protein BC828DRAFT_386575 [Blastocladiella britannica]|nr:hypothetical protein BC828DRAFT_386575 [Blastocladiella britannica]
MSQRQSSTTGAVICLWNWRTSIAFSTSETGSGLLWATDNRQICSITSARPSEIRDDIPLNDKSGRGDSAVQRSRHHCRSSGLRHNIANIKGDRERRGSRPIRSRRAHHQSRVATCATAVTFGNPLSIFRPVNAYWSPRSNE